VLKSSTISLSGSSFSSNVATQKGGAIYLDWEALVLLNAVFTENSAQNGGAIYFIKYSKFERRKGFLIRINRSVYDCAIFNQ